MYAIKETVKFQDKKWVDSMRLIVFHSKSTKFSFIEKRVRSILKSCLWVSIFIICLIRLKPTHELKLNMIKVQSPNLTIMLNDYQRKVNFATKWLFLASNKHVILFLWLISQSIEILEISWYLVQIVEWEQSYRN